MALRRIGIDHCPRKGDCGEEVVDLLLWAHTDFGNLKTWHRGTLHGVSPKHPERCLDEFFFRLDGHWRETELFTRVLHRALDSVPCLYRIPTAERIG